MTKLPTIKFLGKTYLLHLNARALRMFREKTGDDPFVVLFDAWRKLESTNVDSAGDELRINLGQVDKLPIEFRHVEALCWALLKSKRQNPPIGDLMEEPDEYESFLEELDAAKLMEFASKMPELLAQIKGDERPTTAEATAA